MQIYSYVSALCQNRDKSHRRISIANDTLFREGIILNALEMLELESNSNICRELQRSSLQYVTHNINMATT